MLAIAIQGLGEGAIIALVAVGLVLVYKGSGVLNLAQGEIGGFSLFVAYAFLGRGSANGPLLLLATVVIATGLGIAVERTVMRPLVDRPPIQGTIATLGITIVLIQLAVLNAREGFGGFLDPGLTGYPTPIPKVLGPGAITFLGATLETGRIVAMLATAGAGAALLWFFANTKFGLGVVAATSDNTVARLLGIPVRQVYRFTWGIGGALSGLAAALFSSLVQFNPGTMTLTLIGALAAAVIGGLDSILGAIVGGLLIGVVRAVVPAQFNIGGIENVTILALVVLTLMVRPRGLFGGAGADA